jgi:BirA family transcriptional regulator, biotin operon repressor / biotin---[acetyl-CoA-carboxylase] ligase
LPYRPDRAIGGPIRSVVLEDVGSTNTEAFDRARAGDAGPLWVVARRQTHGRGRAGRRWVSEAGNLYASLLQRLNCQPGSVHQISLLAGVAVMEAIEAAAGERRIAGLRLKWPNDVLIGRAKCAGILPESITGESASEVTAVIGVGINLAWYPAGLARPVTALAAHGLDVSPDSMLALLATSMQRWLDTWCGGRDFALVRAAWLERAGPAGESVSVDTGREIITGRFLDLASDGALVLSDRDGVQRRVTFGEATLAGPVTPEAC